MLPLTMRDGYARRAEGSERIDQQGISNFFGAVGKAAEKRNTSSAGQGT